MIKKILLYIVLLFFAANISYAQSGKTIVTGKYTSTKQTKLLKQFTASKGDIIEIKVNALHKKRGVKLWVKQHPGNSYVLFYNNMRNVTKSIVVPTDAIYQIYYGGEKLDFNIEVLNHTNKPSGPGRGNPVYVRIPDTLHTSGYVNIPVGESYTLSPYKEKVVLQTNITSEQISNRDFFTGVDKFEIDIPGNVKDDYRNQKLLSYSFLLTVGGASSYNAMMGVVDAGIDAFVKLPEPKSKNKGKVKKGKGKDRYDFTEKLDEESNKLETVKGLVEIANDGADTLAPGSSTSNVLETTAFVLDGGIQEVALENALDAVGAPKEAMAIYGAVNDFPSVTDIAKDAAHKIIPKIKGRARLTVWSEQKVKKTYPIIPQKEFWIQSAMNKGTTGGCLDIPGHPTTGQKGQNIKIWDIDDGADRKFKLVPSTTYKGYYEIRNALPGGMTLDVNQANTHKKGANIHLWERNNSKAQQFFFKHLGNGKFKILTVDNFPICLDDRKNKNGTNVHIWGPQDGAWTEWYLIDPVTKTAFVPTQTGTYETMEKYLVLDKRNGYINEKITVKNPGASEKIYVRILRENSPESKAKLLIEAQYEITDSTDVIKYKRTTTPVNTKDFWTAYKVNYSYAIMFEDQMQPYYTKISGSEYYSSLHPKSEVIKQDDHEQKMRLAKYDFLTKKE
jgi:hypothetical protein